MVLVHGICTTLNEFNIPISPTHIRRVANKSCKLLTESKLVIDVQGDGNCWVRCLSVWLTNCENNHHLLRMRLFEVID